MYLPDDNGDFNLNSQEDITFSTLVVEGPSPQALESSVVQSPTTLSSAVPYRHLSHPSHSGVVPPVFRSVVAPRKGATFNLKVLLAKMERGPSGKCHFHMMNQTFMELTEKNARVSDITEYIQNCWGEQEELIIVTSDGLRVEDCDGTRGIHYKQKKSEVC